MHLNLPVRSPLFWISLALIAGIIVGGWIGLSVFTWEILAGIILTLTIAWLVLGPRFHLQIPGIPVSIQYVIAFSLFAAACGAALYRHAVPEVSFHNVAWYSDRPNDILVTGTITRMPDERDGYTNLRLQVEAVDAGYGSDRPVEGLILARVNGGERYHYGERIRLRGRLMTPPQDEDFSYRDYLARQGIIAYMPEAEVTRLPGDGGNPFLSMTYGLKEKALSTLYRLFPDPEASLLAGVLLGVDTGLPDAVQQAFKDTGTAHIIAISGFNITIISGLLISLFSRFLGRWRGLILAVLGIAFYTVLVGAEPSVLRAAFMGTMTLIAWQLGRVQSGLYMLIVTAAFMALLNPLILQDVGFQLSFTATLGLILYAQPFQQAAEHVLSRWLPEEKAASIASPIATYVLFTLAAQLTTLPVIAYHFKRISIISMVANPFILPAQPPLMVLGGLSLLLGMFYLPLGRLVSIAAWPFSAYTIRMVELFDHFPGGVLVLGEFSLLFVVLFYVVLFGMTFASDLLKRFIERVRLLLTPVAGITILLVLTLFAWRVAVTSPDGRLHVTFLDVGSADGVLIQTPTGRYVLVNGGASPSALSSALGRRLPPFHRELDFFIAASTQEEQLAALPRVLEIYSPRAVLWAGSEAASYSSRLLKEYLVDSSVPLTYAEAGMTLDLGGGAALEVVNVNERGAILMIEWGGFRTLLPVGVNFEALSTLDDGKDIGPLTALLLAESGYAPANPAVWVANLRPQVIVLSVDAADSAGLPDEEVLEEVSGTSLLRTDLNGWIHLTTNGRKYWVEVEKE